MAEDSDWLDEREEQYDLLIFDDEVYSERARELSWARIEYLSDFSREQTFVLVSYRSNGFTSHLRDFVSRSDLEHALSSVKVVTKSLPRFSGPRSWRRLLEEFSHEKRPVFVSIFFSGRRTNNRYRHLHHRFRWELYDYFENSGIFVNWYRAFPSRNGWELFDRVRNESVSYSARRNEQRALRNLEVSQLRAQRLLLIELDSKRVEVLKRSRLTELLQDEDFFLDPMDQLELPQRDAPPDRPDRHLSVELDKPAGQESNQYLVYCRLHVELQDTPKAALKAKMPIDEELGEATIAITHADGVSCLSTPSSAVTFEEGKKSSIAIFMVEVTDENDCSLTVSVSQAGVFKGEIFIEHLLQEFERQAAHQMRSSRRVVAKLVEPEVYPDLIVSLVGKDFDIRISSPRNVLNKDEEPLGQMTVSPQVLRKDVRNTVAQLYRDSPSTSEVVREVELIGAQIRDAMPERLVTALADERVSSVFFRLAADCDFPIELTLVSSSEGSEQLLSQKCTVSRWYRESRAASNCGLFEVKSIAMIEGELGKGFEDEKNAVLNSGLTTESHTICRAKNEVREKILETKDHQCIHFKGHVRSDEGLVTGLSLASGETLRLAEIGSRKKDAIAFEAEPIVFFNGCDSALGSELIGGVRSLPFHFCRLNSTAYIGTMWEVDEDAGSLFTKNFYAFLGAGKTVPNALRMAATALESHASVCDEPTERMAHYLASKAYVYFGAFDLRITNEMEKNDV